MSDEQLDLLEWLAAHSDGAPEAMPAPDGAPAKVDVTPIRLYLPLARMRGQAFPQDC